MATEKLDTQRYAEYLARFTVIDFKADEAPMSFREWLKVDQEYEDTDEDFWGRSYIPSDEMKRFLQLESQLRWRPVAHQGRTANS